MKGICVQIAGRPIRKSLLVSNSSQKSKKHLSSSATSGQIITPVSLFLLNLSPHQSRFQFQPLWNQKSRLFRIKRSCATCASCKKTSFSWSVFSRNWPTNRRSENKSISVSLNKKGKILTVLSFFFRPIWQDYEGCSEPMHHLRWRTGSLQSQSYPLKIASTVLSHFWSIVREWSSRSDFI